MSLTVYNSEAGDVLTDIHYKETNTHDYLNYTSHHPSHIKNNIPFVLAKNIIVATSDGDMMEKNLLDLKSWLLNCGYPKEIIQRGIHNARLQGPALPPAQKITIPFISSYYSNFESSNILETAKNLIQNSKNTRIKEAFNNVEFIHARRQPPNILQRITNAKFITKEEHKIQGITHCGRYCKICEIYLQECSSFTTANGKVWTIKCHITCNSKNVLYYLVCAFCLEESYTGKTDDIRERTNNHITCMRNGTGSNLFDKHVHSCSRTGSGKRNDEPFFKLYAFMVLSDYNKLRNQERRLHLLNYDTINASHT